MVLPRTIELLLFCYRDQPLSEILGTQWFARSIIWFKEVDLDSRGRFETEMNPLSGLYLGLLWFHTAGATLKGYRFGRTIPRLPHFRIQHGAPRSCLGHSILDGILSRPNDCAREDISFRKLSGVKQICFWILFRLSDNHRISTGAGRHMKN